MLNYQRVGHIPILSVSWDSLCSKAAGKLTQQWLRCPRILWHPAADEIQGAGSVSVVVTAGAYRAYTIWRSKWSKDIMSNTSSLNINMYSKYCSTQFQNELRPCCLRPFLLSSCRILKRLVSTESRPLMPGQCSHSPRIEWWVCRVQCQLPRLRPVARWREGRWCAGDSFDAPDHAFVSKDIPSMALAICRHFIRSSLDPPCMAQGLCDDMKSQQWCNV